MVLHKMDQHSEAWFDIKARKISGTRFDPLMMGDSTAGHNDLIAELAAETITGKMDTGGYVSFDMQRGTDLEPEARDWYKLNINEHVSEIGFIEPDPGTEFHGLIGISPDGLIGNAIHEKASDGQKLIIDVKPIGILEIKCPKIKTHFSYLKKGGLPTTYNKQVQAQLFVTGLDFVDFMSYYPGLKPFIIRVTKDPFMHEDFEKRLRIIVPRVKEQIEIYNNYNYLL